MQDIKVGDSLFYYPSYLRGKVQQVKIIGETSKSWIIGDCNRNNKVIKATLKRNILNYGSDQFYTELGLIELDKRNKLISQIQNKINSGWKEYSIEKLEKMLEAMERP